MRIILGLALLLSAVTASANDSSIPFIKVNSVKSVNGEITFKGGDAYKIYEALGLSGSGAPWFTQRSVLITGPDGSVSIYCNQKRKNNKQDNDYSKPIETIPSTTECSISFGRPYESDNDGGDNHVWEPNSCQSRN
ncbi:hypothetical protein DOM22_12160 [Bdellovibrio sp. ZAP7]|uniref:hypothetical protein n=1 Tax=Bdellovibrio sp. ZAP7 TaxID=2231053 RepID=UPI0011592B2F|nr:hypothetical protein [Bdellovibrio sp. ZAP7]QDK45850.1 hypothetical protein DOM22_12160 [Bdellovibrio sp. ZAP7]